MKKAIRLRQWRQWHQRRPSLRERLVLGGHVTGRAGAWTHSSKVKTPIVGLLTSLKAVTEARRPAYGSLNSIKEPHRSYRPRRARTTSLGALSEGKRAVPLPMPSRRSSQQCAAKSCGHNLRQSHQNSQDKNKSYSQSLSEHQY